MNKNEWVSPILAPDGRIFDQTFRNRKDAIEARKKFFKELEERIIAEDEARRKA